MATLDVAEAIPAALDVEDAPSVLALVPEVNGATDPWRIQGPIEALQAAGYPCDWRLIMPNDTGRLLQLTQPSWRPDVVLFQRSWWCRWDGPLAAWATALKRAGTALLMDTDDNLLDPRVPARIAVLDGTPPAWVEQQRRARLAGLRLMDGVTVATSALAEAVRPHTRPGTPIHVLRNAIVPERYLAAGRAATPHQEVTIGWAGTRRGGEDFEVTGLAQAWGRLAARYPGVTFTTLGVARGAFDGHVPLGRLVDLGPQLPVAYPAALARLDIGCCSLAPGWFNETKSPQKAWELSLCGAAVVASPTVYGDDPGYLEHGGLLAAGVDAWEHHLSRLIEHAEERRSRADALAAWVLQEKTLEVNLHRWPEAWKAIADQAARRPVASLGHGGGQAAAQRARQKAKAKAKRRR